MVFSDTPVSPNNKTDRQDRTEILLMKRLKKEMGLSEVVNKSRIGNARSVVKDLNSFT